MPLQDGDTVIVHYTGSLSDGTVFDTTVKGTPLQFTIGADEVLPDFEKAVRKLEMGVGTTITIPAENAYGFRNEDAVQEYPRDNFPPEPVPEPGWVVEMESEDGMSLPATIIEVTDESYTLDFNHPLAGHDLTFEIELISYGVPAEQGDESADVEPDAGE